MELVGIGTCVSGRFPTALVLTQANPPDSVLSTHKYMLSRDCPFRLSALSDSLRRGG